MSQVYFTDLDTRLGGDLLKKFENLIIKAGIDNIDFQDKLVAIKLHMGEWGNIAFLRQHYAKVLCDHIKERGGKPFITDCNTLYPGYRGNAVDHLTCAAWNGYNQLSVGVPIIIADGLRGTDERAIPIEGAVYCKEPKIGTAIAEADVVISLAHAKGHENAGFGGCLKNLGMGCGSKKGKMEMHSHGTPHISHNRCIGCGNCVKHCANDGVEVINGKAVIKEDKCLGCGYCMAFCPKGAINCKWDEANSVLNCKIAEYTAAVVKDKPAFFINIATDVQYNCDCCGEHHPDLIPDVGYFASFDPVALDRATIDTINKMPIIPGSPIGHCHDGQCDEAHKGHDDQCHNAHDCNIADDCHNAHDAEKDIFAMAHPETHWQAGLEHAEKLGLGSQDYELITLK